MSDEALHKCCAPAEAPCSNCPVGVPCVWSEKTTPPPTSDA